MREKKVPVQFIKIKMLLLNMSWSFVYLNVLFLLYNFEIGKIYHKTVCQTQILKYILCTQYTDALHALSLQKYT